MSENGICSDKAHIIEIIGQHSLFNGLDADAVCDSLNFLLIMSVSRSTHIFHVGEPANHIYLLFNGIVKKTFISPGGDEKIISLNMSGDIFGELFLGKYRFRIATAVTITESVIGKIEENNLYRLIDRYPQIGRNLICHLADEQRETLARMHALMHIDARHRLLGTLLSLARRFESDDRGWVQLPHAITQSDLANIACLNRTTVSYHLNVLRASGVLGGVRRDLIIKTDLVASLLKEIGLELLE